MVVCETFNHTVYMPENQIKELKDVKNAELAMSHSEVGTTSGTFTLHRVIWFSTNIRNITIGIVFSPMSCSNCSSGAYIKKCCLSSRFASWAYGLTKYMQLCFSHWPCLHFPARSIELKMSEILVALFLTEGKFYKHYTAMDQTSAIIFFSSHNLKRDSWRSKLHWRCAHVTVRRTYLYFFFISQFCFLSFVLFTPQRSAPPTHLALSLAFLHHHHPPPPLLLSSVSASLFPQQL